MLASRARCLTMAFALTAFPAYAAQNALPAHGYLSFAIAQEAANAALAHCTQAGHRVAVAVLDEGANIKVILVGDGASPLTAELGRKKALTAVMMGRTSAEYSEMWKANPNAPLMHPELVPNAGGVPIMAGDRLIGAIAVSGVRGVAGGDEGCARAGIDKIADRLR